MPVGGVTMIRSIIESWDTYDFEKLCNHIADTLDKSNGDVETLVENYINGQVDIEECMEILYML